jgi:membrane-associated phospholipid phosphatase
MSTKNIKNHYLKEIITTIFNKFGWRILLSLSAACGFLLFFGWLTEEVFEGDTRIFDESVRNYIHQFSWPQLVSFMIFFSFLGSPLFLIFLGTIIIAAFWYFKDKRAIVLLLITMAGEIILEFGLKQFFGRARPDVFFDYPLPSSFSFPSGHAFGSLCFYGILAWLITQKPSGKITKITIWATSATLILLIGFSRLYLGVHYPSDVLAGYSVGLFWVGVVALSDGQRQHKD